MIRLTMTIKYWICHWLFTAGFFREVITTHRNGKIHRVYAIGFSPLRRWREYCQ